MPAKPPTLVRWHTPHPGLLGCPVRIPGAARRAALELDGTTSTVEEGLARVRAAVGRGYAAVFRAGGILLVQDLGETMNYWRVIRADRA